MGVFEHFRPEERPLVEHLLDLIRRAEERYFVQRSDFLDPRARQILISLVGKNEKVRLSFFGGFPNAERQRALLSPPYAAAAEDDFAVSVLEVDYPHKFVTLAHRDLLGAILGCGVDRRKIGDLLVGETHVQFICTADIAAYLSNNLVSVGRQPVSVRPAKTILHTEEQWFEDSGTVASLRLDAVIAEIYRLSRAAAAERISRGLVKVNWQLIERRDFEVIEGDILSLRGAGRSKILSAGELTKKHKIRLYYGKLN
ncbi:MAG: YlmH/Sll1252 family protein [Sporolactobacillus sp.]